MAKKNYDLIFSLGEACSCTQALRKYYLQTYSYPFDWLFGSDFLGRCNILVNKFENFIEKDDLEFSYEERSIKCTAYHNKMNDIIFNHDFKKEMPFDDAYELVKEKYNRRINRLLDTINNSKTVLIVYMEAPTTNHNTITNEDIIKGYFMLKDTFGEKVDLLYIRNDNKNNSIEFFENGKITKVSANYKEYNQYADYSADIKKLKSIFSKYKLNLPFGYITTKRISRLIVNFVPIKSYRQKLRKILHI